MTAEVFAVAWRRRDDVPVGNEARLWLFGVARRVLANQRRGHDRLERFRQRLVVAAERVEVEPDTDLLSELRAALHELGDDDRAVVMMRCWEGLSVSEIATVLECTPNAVSIRLHRARKQLAARLASKEAAIDRSCHRRTCAHHRRAAKGASSWTPLRTTCSN